MTGRRPSRVRRWAPLVIGLLLAAAAVWMWWGWRNPLALYERMSRRALARAGLERSEMPLPGGGALVYWQGGRGPDLVLLHGAGDQAGAWARVVPSLATGYRLLVPDLPGHGESAPAAGPLQMTVVYAGLEALLESAPIDEPPVLAGNSMGAWLAMVYAHRHPALVARVVAVNGGALRGPPSDLSLMPADRAAAARLMEALRDPANPRVPPNVLDDIVRRAPAGPIGRLAQDPAAMEAMLLDGRLGELSVPVDLLWGESDRLLPVSYAERLAELLPRARLTLIPRCGHVPQNECPERFADRLLELLAAGEPGGPGVVVEAPPWAQKPAAGEGADDPR